MAGDPSASKVNLRAGWFRAPSHRAGDGHGVAAAVEERAGQAAEYFHRITCPKQQIRLVHGEPLRSLALPSAPMEEYPGKSFIVAQMGMTLK